MQKEYNDTFLAKLFIFSMFLIGIYGLKDTYISGNFKMFLFFLLGTPIFFIGIIISFYFKIVLTAHEIYCRLLPKVHKTYKWDEIIRIEDDSFLVWHLYWIVSAKKTRFWWSWKKNLAIGNGKITINNYPSFLANIITHVKPGTPVEESILRHLNMEQDDIGIYYKQDKWIDNVKINSYWKEKIL